MSERLRGPVRTLLLAAWFGAAAIAVVVVAVVAPLLRDRGTRLRAAAFRRWCRGAARIVGLRIDVAGVPPLGPFFLVANHLSYLDVIVLGATVRATFVAKADVAAWPLIGWLGRAVDTTFIDRTRKRAPVDQVEWQTSHNRKKKGQAAAEAMACGGGKEQMDDPASAPAKVMACGGGTQQMTEADMAAIAARTPTAPEARPTA